MLADPVNSSLKIIIGISILTTAYFLLGLGGFIALLTAVIASFILVIRKYRHLRTHGILCLI